MNYLAPLQRQSDGKWDYTRNGHPTGYCHAYRPFEKKDLWIFCNSQEAMDRENEKLGKYAEKYHACGHDTKEEACACYRQYLLDNLIRYDGKDMSSQQKCEVCGEWTQRFAHGPYEIVVLCDKHCNREDLEKVFHEVGIGWES